METAEIVRILSELREGRDPENGAIFPRESPYQRGDVVRALSFAVQLVEKRALIDSRKQSYPLNTGKPWSSEEDAKLIAEFDRNAPIPDIAKQHDRTMNAVRARLVKLGKIADDGVAFRSYGSR